MNSKNVETWHAASQSEDMSELAIETSSAHGSIALWQDGVCVIEV